MKKIVSLILTFSVFIQGCTMLKVVERSDKDNGYFYENIIQANTIISLDTVNMDNYKPLLVVPKSEFLVGMSKNLNFFDEVITLEDLEKRIIEANLQEKVPTVNSYIGLSNAYKAYKPFLYLNIGPDKRDKKIVQQLKLVNPNTGKEIFLSELESSYPNDQGVWYPLYNSLIDYLRRTSKSYK